MFALVWKWRRDRRGKTHYCKTKNFGLVSFFQSSLSLLSFFTIRDDHASKKQFCPQWKRHAIVFTICPKNVNFQICHVIIQTHYARRRGCPTTLRTYLIPQAMKLIMEKTQTSPEECGFDENRMVFQPLKLVRIVVGIVNSIILSLLDNSKLYEVPLPPSSEHASELTKLKAPPKISTDAIKNTRRTMEDRMMVIDDFNAYFNTNVSQQRNESEAIFNWSNIINSI